jgi:hypothetical protein
LVAAHGLAGAHGLAVAAPGLALPLQPVSPMPAPTKTGARAADNSFLRCFAMVLYSFCRACWTAPY